MCLSKEIINFRKLRKTVMIQLLYVRKNEIGLEEGKDLPKVPQRLSSEQSYFQTAERW